MIPEVNTESIYFDVSVRMRGGEREVSDLRESTNATLRHNSGTSFIRKPFMCIERFRTQLRPKIMAFKVVCITLLWEHFGHGHHVWNHPLASSWSCRVGGVSCSSAFMTLFVLFPIYLSTATVQFPFFYL